MSHGRPVEIHLDRLLPTADLWEAWRAFSDTDRFNRDAKLGFTFSAQSTPQGEMRHFGHVRRLGMKLRWEDEPFVIRAPELLISTRRFETGPLARLVTTIRLQDNADGIRLAYHVALTPKNPLLRWAVQIDATTSIRPMLERVIDETARRLAHEAEIPASSLADRLAGVPWARAIGAFVERGDPRDVDRIRPGQLARAWGADPDEVLDALLVAVDREVLELRFDLLCPQCQGPSTRLSILDLDAAQPHCPSCQIRYDGTLPDSVEISFRPHGTVREVQVPVDCVNSVVHTPHVIARVRLDPGQETDLETHLDSGAYRLRSRNPHHQPASLETRRGLTAQRAAVELTDRGLAPVLLRLGPGACRLSILNRTADVAYVQLERRWRPVDSTPLSALIERPERRRYLTDGELNVREISGVLVVQEHGSPPRGSEPAEQTYAMDPDHRTFDLDAPTEETAWQHEADGVTVRLFPEFEAALDATLPARADTAALILPTTLLLARIGERDLALGSSLEHALSDTRRVGLGRIAAPAAFLDEPGPQAALRSKGLSLLHSEHQPLAWIAAPLPIPSADGSSSPYAMERELGRGGMGIVFASTDPVSGAEIAVKVLHPNCAADPSCVQRFYTEGRLASRLNHPHTVRVLDYGATSDTAWIVMERLYGEELRARIARSTPPVDFALDCALAVLDALADAHDQGIVHRDIKPSNLFLCTHPTLDHPKVVDFGIAIDVEDALAQAPSILGTPRYIAPEQVAGQRVDARADLYSLGLVLYEMFTGQIPFEGADAKTLARARLNVVPEPLHARVPGLPRAISDVVMRAIERDPDVRWPSARAMADALIQARRSTPPSPAPSH